MLSLLKIFILNIYGENMKVICQGNELSDALKLVIDNHNSNALVEYNLGTHKQAAFLT